MGHRQVDSEFAPRRLWAFMRALWNDLRAPEQVFASGRVETGVENIEAEQGIDLVRVGAQGAGCGLGALFGSNVDRVPQQAPCPSSVARPLQPAAAAAELEVLT